MRRKQEGEALTELIQSRDNPKIREYCKLNQGKQARRKLGKFTLEGKRIVLEALRSGVKADYALIGAGSENDPELQQALEEKAILVYSVSEAVEKRIAETSGPQGVYLVCQAIEPCAPEALYRAKKLLCLYDIQDPGNLGTMIRSADAFGFDGIVLSRNSCDLFSPKVLRSTMGSVFHLPYYIAEDMETFEREMQAHGRASAAAVVSDAELAVGYCNLPEIHLLYIGNEGNGLPEAFAKQCTYRVTLPMKGKAESLNAAMAASVLMWELSK